MGMASGSRMPSAPVPVVAVARCPAAAADAAGGSEPIPVPIGEDLRAAGASHAGRIESELRLEYERQMAVSRERLETLKQSHDTLRTQVEQLRDELAQRSAQLSELTSELGTRDIRAASLRHEVRVKDALLGHLREEMLRLVEGGDGEVERLLERAFSPLAAILTREQTAAAAAAGERAPL